GDEADQAEQERHDQEACPDGPGQQIVDSEREGDQQERGAERKCTGCDAETHRCGTRPSRLFANLDAGEGDFLADECPQVRKNATDKRADGVSGDDLRIHATSRSNRSAVRRDYLLPSSGGGGSMWMTTSASWGNFAISLSLTTCDVA